MRAHKVHGFGHLYVHRTTGRYPDGRRVCLFWRHGKSAGTPFWHLEAGPFAVHIHG